MRRALAAIKPAYLDPFAMMDQTGEVDYAAGEPKGTLWHPHRGFETVTYMIDGVMDHLDSNGGGTITNGDTPWMTARRGSIKPDEDLNGPALAEVYERWVAGEPLRAVAKDMADRGIRAPNGDILDNSRWIVIMDSGFAAGLIRKRKPGVKSKRFDSWDWFPGSHKALIPVGLWEAYKSKRLASLG
ncbi:pirin family protein [Nonomuraea sp. NPDC050691]|uniref:pirin family protein n=1 Tax=Nonomuraea sp. NPDC050691 TaxID=3155661 RepID=UPI0033F25BD9